MAKIKKTLSEKEIELQQLILDTKKKLKELQSKQKIEIGELACNHGLHAFDLSLLDEEFKKLSSILSKNKNM